MKNKIKKVLYISGLVIGVTVLILYVIFPNQTEYYFNCVKDFINKPLPIVGISLFIIGQFVYKIFVLTKFGQGKLKEVSKENEALKDELVEIKEKLEEANRIREEATAKINEKIDETDKRLADVCTLSKNVKINALLKNEEKENV